MFHAWFYPLSCVLFQLWSTFHMISWTNLLTRATVPAACFLLFVVPGKSENEYSRNWTGQKTKCLFFRKTHGARIRDGVVPRGAHTTWPRGQAQAAPGGGLAALGCPSVSLFAYKKPSNLKTSGGSTFFQKEFRSAATTRFHETAPETPFWHPPGTGNWRRSPPSSSPSLIHRPSMFPTSMSE